jgi:hypothetical protein
MHKAPSQRRTACRLAVRTQRPPLVVDNASVTDITMPSPPPRACLVHVSAQLGPEITHILGPVEPGPLETVQKT